MGTASEVSGSLRRALRVGVLQQGSLVEERLLGAADEVRVGSDARCTIVLPPQPGVPRSAALFVVHKGHLHVQVPAGLSARVASAAGAPVTELRAGPGGDPVRQPLDVEARGRVELGEVTLLFQLVRVAPPSRLSLPPSLHESLMHQLDGWMVGTALASFLAHAVLVVVLRGYDPPRTPSIEDIPDRAGVFVHMDLPLPKVPPPPTPPPPPTAGSGGRLPRVTPPRGRRVDATPAETPEERRARLQAAVAALLSANGPRGTPGNLATMLQGGATLADAERALAEANAVTTARRGDVPALRGSSDGARATTIAGLRIPVVGEVATGDRTDVATGGHRLPRCPGGVCTPDPPAPPQGECDPRAVFARLHVYRGALVACYEKLRLHDPGAAGKVRLDLTIGQDGHVRDAALEPEGLDSELLEHCVEGAARRFVFPELDCREMSVSQTIVFTPAN